MYGALLDMALYDSAPRGTAETKDRPCRPVEYSEGVDHDSERQGDHSDERDLPADIDDLDSEPALKRIKSDLSDPFATPGPSPTAPADQPAEQSPKTKPSVKANKRAGSEKKCKCCGTQNTPVWRWGGEAKDTLLCNACSLRIRRSNARPSHRSRMPMDRPAKKQNTGSQSSGDTYPGSPAFEMMTREEVDALRQRLVGFMSQEKERLMSCSEGSTLPSEDDWTLSLDWSPRDMRHNNIRYSPYEWQPSRSPVLSTPPMWPKDTEAAFWNQPALAHREIAHISAHPVSTM